MIGVGTYPLRLRVEQLRVKSILLNVVLLILVATCLLPLLFLYVVVFLGIGGGWAYAGANGCHFQINAIGYAMLGVPVFTLCCFSWKFLRKDSGQ